ncbi:phosphatidylserine decarboxylase [Rubrobacter aplysinae]|uniref:phosphatidylserine decarboxylase n=1 Tax=Rubrobacter aplysinae TaxID=909625 RepID=UPI000ABC1479|nr:phosphatidylserine decarboxylase [Rubrobacter aplysinae]
MTRRSWEAARPYVVAPVLAGLLLLALGKRAGWLGLGAGATSLLFFRDPERRLDPEPDVAYAAADGYVKSVEEVEETSFPGGRALRVSTFLSLHNVHVNRSPVAGEISRMEEMGGGYAPALFAGSEENYGKRVEIAGERGPAVVVQKAGMIARRISSWTSVGDRVGPGDRIGIIHFGSRTDVLLPAGSAQALVRPGQRARAGLTPLFRYHGDRDIREPESE